MGNTLFKLCKVIVLSLHFFLCFHLGFAFAENSIQIADLTIREMDVDDPIQKEFIDTYKSIRSGFNDKKIALEDCERAASLAIDLQKYLIKTEADEKILKMDTLTDNTQKRSRAVEELIELAAGRAKLACFVGYGDGRRRLDTAQGIGNERHGLRPFRQEVSISARNLCRPALRRNSGAPDQASAAAVTPAS